MNVEDVNDDKPTAAIYRTNGVTWALFLRYGDGTEEPADIFSTAFAMLADAAKHHRPVIEWQPQLLGCETADEECAVETLIAAHEALMSVYDQRD